MKISHEYVASEARKKINLICFSLFAVAVGIAIFIICIDQLTKEINRAPTIYDYACKNNQTVLLTCKDGVSRDWCASGWWRLPFNETGDLYMDTCPPNMVFFPMGANASKIGKMEIVEKVEK